MNWSRADQDRQVEKQAREQIEYNRRMEEERKKKEEDQIQEQLLFEAAIHVI